MAYMLYDCFGKDKQVSKAKWVESDFVVVFVCFPQMWWPDILLPADI